MSFFKGLQWFEWLLVGVVVAMLGAGYILWNKYDAKTEQLGGIKAENAVLSETVKYKDASATITDEVVTSFVQSQTDEKAELEQSRKGVIDEYIDLATRTDEPPVQSAPVVAKTPPVRQPPPKANTTDRSPGDSDSVTAIGALAQRMHEHYCKAAPERGRDCPAIGAAPGVLR